MAVDDELARVLPVIEQLVAHGATVSIDTTRAVVARAAVERGASIINDVSGGLADDDDVRGRGPRPVRCTSPCTGAGTPT